MFSALSKSSQNRRAGGLKAYVVDRLCRGRIGEYDRKKLGCLWVVLVGLVKIGEEVKCGSGPKGAPK